MKPIIEIFAWVVNHWWLWGGLFFTTGILKLLQIYINKGPNIIA